VTEDYPRTVEEFETRFSSEEACREYLFQLRWPEGFRCPRCNHSKAWKVSDTLWQCGQCDHQTSVMAGTVFQDTRKPLRMWFRAMWYVMCQKNGASALGLQRVLGLGSYQTAWAWLHKLRRAMVRSGRDRLVGWIEVDETYVGGWAEGKKGRSSGEKSLVVIAAEVVGSSIGRIRLQSIPDASAISLHPFIESSVQLGSTIHTDGWKGYLGIDKKGYDHELSLLRGRPRDANKLLPHVHRVASLLKRWLLGTHQGAVEPQHLAYYLDEFTFRFNRRTSRSRGKLFYRLMQQAVATAPTTYAAIVAPSKHQPKTTQDIGAT
jgi:transposase-like protein/ribosomal protein L37AE/L43A